MFLCALNANFEISAFAFEVRNGVNSFGSWLGN